TMTDPERTGPARSTPPADAPEPEYPSIPGYEILGELGRGGMGKVYQARHLALKRPVALKVILSGELATPEELGRFRSQGEALARWRHPNVARVYGGGRHAGHPFFSLEFCAGGSLGAKLRQKLPEPREAAALVEKLARAMHAVHGCNVVHRDLKPANVLLA